MIFVTEPDLPKLDEYIDYLRQIWDSKILTNNGDLIKKLEVQLKDYLKINHMNIVTNGTIALQIALKALDLKGEIITTPFTFAATTNAIIWEGLKIVFSDIDRATFNIDPNDIEKKITKNTSAILAVHIFGNPCSLEELQELSDRYNIRLIYDAAQSFSTEYNDKSIVSFGDVSILSFHATKVFNTAEGGALVSSDLELNRKIRLLSTFGLNGDDRSKYPGINGKMNEFQAALGLCNLKTIDDKINLRMEKYNRYVSGLNCIEGIRFQSITASRYNYSYMPILFKTKQQRNLVFQTLLSEDIFCKKYFPLTSNFEYIRTSQENIDRKCLPNAQYISDRIICLPIYPTLKNSDIDNIIRIISQKV